MVWLMDKLGSKVPFWTPNYEKVIKNGEKSVFLGVFCNFMVPKIRTPGLLACTRGRLAWYLQGLERWLSGPYVVAIGPFPVDPGPNHLTHLGLLLWHRWHTSAGPVPRQEAQVSHLIRPRVHGIRPYVHHVRPTQPPL